MKMKYSYLVSIYLVSQNSEFWSFISIRYGGSIDRDVNQ